jgi:hypothetical protein
MRRVLLASSLVLFALGTARAVDQTVLGQSLVIKNPSTAEKRKITVKAKEKSSDDSIVGDPITNGATVTITANGSSTSEETNTLSAGANAAGKPFWTGDAVKGFKYSDSKGENGPVKRAQMKLKSGVFQIKVSLDGKIGVIAVVPPFPGTDGCVLLTILGGDSYSVQFASGQVTSHGGTLFKVVKPTIEGSCLTTTTTTSTTTTSTTSTTLAIPFRTPPRPAPLRYRDAVFSTVSVTSNILYGNAINYSGQPVNLYSTSTSPWATSSRSGPRSSGCTAARSRSGTRPRRSSSTK